MKTAERVSDVDASDGFVLARSVLAYERAAETVSGDVLEIGTGTGYGVAILAPRCRKLVTVDKKFTTPSLRATPPLEAGEEVEFRQMRVPPLDFADAAFDFVVTFQVVEHIRRDGEFLSEIARILRPGGKLIISTPNRRMSLTRNPWHVREYSAAEFGALLGRDFSSVEALGVFGDERVKEYYERNRKGVERWARWDVLRLREWLPRWVLRVPYDVANRLNRRALARAGEKFEPENYFFAPVNDEAYDLFYIATK